MSEHPQRRSGGLGWIAMLALPPVIVVVGLIGFFAWQIRKGTIAPKWKPKPAVTNQVSTAGTNK